MALRKQHILHLAAIPSRQFFARASVAFMVVASVGLMMMSRAGSPATVRLRAAVADVVTPVVAVVSAPLDALASAGSWVSDIARLRAENIALKNSNVQLMKWQTLAKDMQAENASLRELMKVVPDKASKYITARIVADVGGPYVRSALISGGSTQGIRKDQPVINEKGLVGRVVEVGEGSARVLLLTDINSRVPVISEGSREKVIMVGNNSKLPTLSYIAPNSEMKVGERVLTSGDGGVFPHGIAVGVIESVEKGVVKVRPIVDSVSSEYVSVVDYHF